MDKVAFYREHIYKEASRAWKKSIGSLSEESINILKNSNILNHEKELKGLVKGTDNIIKKNKGIAVDYDPLVYKKILKRGLKKDKVRKRIDGGQIFGSTVERALDNVKSTNGFSTFNGLIGDNKIVIKGDDISKSPIFKEMAGHLPQGKFNQEYAKQIMNRHEADELRYTNKILKNKKMLRHNPMFNKMVPASYIGSHVSPEVIYAESAHAAIAPKSVKKFLTNLRKGTGEVDSKNIYKFTDSNKLQYGKDGVFDKRKASDAAKEVAKNRLKNN